MGWFGKKDKILKKKIKVLFNCGECLHCDYTEEELEAICKAFTQEEFYDHGEGTIRCKDVSAVYVYEYEDK